MTVDNREKLWTPYLRHILGKVTTSIYQQGIPPDVFDQNDLWQAAWEAFGRAEQNFNPLKAKNHGAKFTSYLYKCVYFEVRKYMLSHAITLIREHEHEDTNILSVPDNIKHVERNDLLRFAMSDLSTDEINILYLHYVRGLSFRKIQNMLGVTYTTVRNRMSACLAKLRKKIADEDLIDC